MFVLVTWQFEGVDRRMNARLFDTRQAAAVAAFNHLVSTQWFHYDTFDDVDEALEWYFDEGQFEDIEMGCAIIEATRGQ